MGKPRQLVCDFLVLPGLLWVRPHFQASAVEEDCCLEVVFAMESGSASLDGHDLAVEPFREGVGDLVLAVTDDLGQA